MGKTAFGPPKAFSPSPFPKRSFFMFLRRYKIPWNFISAQSFFIGNCLRAKALSSRRFSMQLTIEAFFLKFWECPSFKSLQLKER